MQQNQWVNYHHLFYFKTIAIEGGIAQASKKLRIGPPTLSTQLKQFEESLGYALFHRSNRSMHLTAEGKSVLDYAVEIFRLGDEMIDTLKDGHLPGQTVNIEIGVTEFIPKHLALDLYKEAVREIPCKVSLISGKHEDLCRSLKAHRLDLVLSNEVTPSFDRSRFYTKKVGQLSVIVAGTRKFDGLRTDFPSSLNGQPWIAPSMELKLRRDLEYTLRLQNIAMDVKAEVQDTALQKLMALEGIGLVTVVKSAAKEYLHRGDLIEIGTIDGVYEELFFIAATRRQENPVAKILMKEFRPFDTE